MRTLSVATLALPCLLLFPAFAPSHAGNSSASSPDLASSRSREIHRLQAHFDSVLTELRARDVPDLKAVQRARREALIEVLQVYRDAAEFPHNYDFPGEAVPYFVDRKTGVVCAVGHLLTASGRRDIVDRVAATNNNVRVPELAGDSAFTSWADFHGITVAEAARIQAPYILDPPPTASASRNNGFPTMSAVALGGALMTSYWNARPNASGTNRIANGLGMLAGAAALGTGAAAIGDDGAAPAVGAASMVVGAASAWLSTRNVMRYRRVAEEKREAARTTVAPVIPMDGSAGAGVMVTVRF